MSENKNYTIDKNLFQTLLAKQRQDIRKGICTKAEAMEILGLSSNDFYKEIGRPESKIILSKKRGKYIFSSVIREFKRIHGISYSDAIVYDLERS